MTIAMTAVILSMALELSGNNGSDTNGDPVVIEETTARTIVDVTTAVTFSDENVTTAIMLMVKM